MLKNKIELLDESLIDDYKDIALEVLAYSSKLGIGLGWHYLLDLIWILKELEAPIGSTILDAGAGSGLLQFILASRGYNVISVDVNSRSAPDFAKNIYNIEIIGTNKNIKHPFLSWHKIDQKGVNINNGKSINNLPTITFYHGDLKQMTLINDKSIDAIVSVSALEHNPTENLEFILKEFKRVIRNKGKLITTVSAAKKSYFHEPSYSWILDKEDIIKYYDISINHKSNMSRYDEIFKMILNSRRLKDWLASFYYKGDKNGMPWGKWDPKYLPVGILKINK